MLVLNDLTMQSVSETLSSSQLESVRVLNETPTDEAIAESSLLWFLRWFNENPFLGDPLEPNEEDAENSSPAASTSYRAPDPPSFVPCRICLDDFPEAEAISIPGNCKHTFCKDCLSTYVTVKLKEGRYPIVCPSCTTEGTDVRESSVLPALTLTLNGIIATKDVTEDVLEQLDMSEENLERLIEAQLNSHAVSLSCIRYVTLFFTLSHFLRLPF